MEWYNYVACFFAGALLCNFVPHFIKGVAGDKFPTPFANPPAKGLSRPYLNVLWALFNLIISLVLVSVGKVSANNTWSIVVMFLGFALVGISLSFAAETKHTE